MIKQFLAKSSFKKVVGVSAGLTIRVMTEEDARSYADAVLTAYEQTVPWRFYRDVEVSISSGEWYFPLIQKP